MANEKLLNSSLLQEYDTQRKYHLPTELEDLDYKTICTFKITSANTTISPKNLTGLNKIIWGDGTVDNITSETVYSHTYANEGTYIAVFEGVTAIGNDAFKDINNLIDIKISHNVTTLGEWAFVSTNIVTINIPDSVTNMGRRCFTYCPELTNITFSKNITTYNDFILASATASTQRSLVREIEIPYGATTLSNNSFALGSNAILHRFIIPETVQRIGLRAITSSTLQEIVCRAKTPPVLDANSFYNTNNCPIYVPLESLQAYKTATNWVTYADRIRAIVDTSYLENRITPTYETKSILTTDWTVLSSSTPYTYSATITATATISADTLVELINDNPVLFATYGFAIASVSGQSITIYSIGTPATDVSLKIGIGG